MVKQITSLILLLSVTFAVTAGLLNRHEPPAPRIITAGSVITEIVCALGHADDIVATDLTSNYPAAMTALPNIGYRNSINAEGILAQEPSLMLVEKDYVRPELVKQLEGTGVPLHALEKPLAFSQTKALILAIGKILHEEAKAAGLVASMEEDMARLHKQLEQVSTHPKVLFIYARGEGTQMIAGQGTFTENLIAMAGGKQAVSLAGFKTINTETLVAANPDFILMADDGIQSIGGVSGLLRIPGVAQTTAGKNQNIITMDMVMMSNFGPRLPEAVRILAGHIHPEIKP